MATEQEPKTETTRKDINTDGGFDVEKVGDKMLIRWRCSNGMQIAAHCRDVGVTMRIEDLDEAQGLTADMVWEWLHLLDPTIAPSASMFDDIEAVAHLCGDTPQELLRAMNPRMRKGTPSEAARAAHMKLGGLWVQSYGTQLVKIINDCGPFFVTLDNDGDETRWESVFVDRASFWPCDEHGNKVRWPTSADGEML